MNDQPDHTFRLRRLNQDPAQARSFQCKRAGFRHALADAFIDLRLEDRASPAILEIACPVEGPAQWFAPLGREGEPLPLPELIRWECAGDYYDQRVRLYWAELEKHRPPKPRPIQPATPAGEHPVDPSSL